jgi:membrane-associated phospholipid phosphatase
MIPVNMNDNLVKFLLIIDALVLVSTIVTLFFKVSVHSIAAWGFIGVMFFLNLVMDNGAVLYPTLISILLAGIVMSARLKLNVHTPREVFIGAAIGLVTSTAGMIILFPY